MHYLEDFVDSMEQLPKMLREKCSHLLDLDISVQSGLESLDRQVEEFFSMAGSMSQADKDKMFQIIRKDYCTSLDRAGQKVQVAEEMCQLVRMQLVALDEELVKYQADLEADHPGVTAMLQERSLMLDLYELGARKDRHPRSSSLKKHLKNAVKRRVEEGGVEQLMYLEAPQGQFSPCCSVGQCAGEAGAAVATAATQAIIATQQMQQGRRMPGFKASFEAISAAVHEMSLGRVPVSSHQRLQRKKKQQLRRKGGVSAGMLDTSAVAVEEQQPLVQGPPDEPTYCSCNQVSYGNMVACDNEDCLIEWFHYSCVGIETPPRGRWYCPQCTASKKHSDPSKAA